MREVLREVIGKQEERIREYEKNVKRSMWIFKVSTGGSIKQSAKH
jgi:hypothetical protein